MYRAIIIVAIIVAAAGLGGGMSLLSRATAQQTPKSAEPTPDHDHDEHDQDEHEGHDHEEHESDAEDEHAGHDHGGHDEHETVVKLSGNERRRFGIKVATAAPGDLTNLIRLPGEIVLNADRVAHIVPRAPGIVREVLVSVGDHVRAGDVMAWLESAELGEAKVDYLAKWSELGCCTIDLARAQAVHDNTLQLLSLLKTTPTLETLRDFSRGEMGENRGALISAFAELKFAEAAYRRERPLFEKKIASERDYQAAEAAYKKADAMYAATRDSIDFTVRRNLLEAKRALQIREIELKGARRRLFVMGLAADEITDLQALAQPRANGPNTASACNDPNCTGCEHHSTSGASGMQIGAHPAEEKLAWYPLRAPFDGSVIEKHLTLGEKQADDAGAFTVADLDSVWVNIAVYQKDLHYVKESMTVSFSTGAGMPSTRGTIAYVAPVLDRDTRTALARVVLPNPDGRLRPGLFVNAEISVGDQNGAIVIPKKAVQRMDEESVVFLETADGFSAQPVVLGRGDNGSVEVLAGLSHGQRFVTEGAFELKAKIVTSGLDAHAGHGH